ncbi:unnamed protein product, partial [Closterium sp. NIES-64]
MPLHTPPCLPPSQRPPPAPPSSSAPPSPLLSLPPDLLLLSLSRLSPTDLRSAAATCTRLRQLALPAVPSLPHLSLFPHQRSALQWMMGRERGSWGGKGGERGGEGSRRVLFGAR